MSIRRGLIPACAGTTLTRASFTRSKTAHPRLRGDHQDSRTQIPPIVGSSPPARGPPKSGDTLRASRRLIPACAGTTRHRLKANRVYRAHPRLRGDHYAWTPACRSMTGSSPPARGPRRESVSTRAEIRLIPACAGTTRHRLKANRVYRAHPRLRGDHYAWTPACRSMTGSSPPARGPLLCWTYCCSDDGLIPACAGTTVVVLSDLLAGAAHPRLRGDHSRAALFISWRCGSSPPARGPLSVDIEVSAAEGLIPACAGTTRFPRGGGEGL